MYNRSCNMFNNRNHQRRFPTYHGLPPDNKQFFCETCDRDFRNQAMLDDHKKQHQKCNIDGCQFVAHPKVITKHIQMQHSTGLYKKICKLNDPEEIAKWREERKRKYPTKENIQKKDAIKAAKIERGEKMGLQTNKKFKGSFAGQDRNQRNISRPHPQRKFPKKNEQIHSKKAILPLRVPDFNEDILSKLKPFTGIQDLLKDSVGEEQVEVMPFNIDDDYVGGDETGNTDGLKQESLCSALTNLVNNYGSSDEEVDSVFSKEIISKQKKPVSEMCNKPESKSVISSQKQCCEIVSNERMPVNVNESKNVTEAQSDDDSGPEEVKTVVEKTQNTDNVAVDADKKCIKTIHKRKFFKNNVLKKNKPPSTLLRKLLSREIQHERNVVLQCIRYIVNNEYFQNNVKS